MSLDATGMTMNQNDSLLPEDCENISRDYEFEIHAGSRYAKAWPGATFAYDVTELQVEPCSRILIHFVNEDQVRHQWMLHGLPRYLYPGGMFHLESAGGERRSGSFILPGDDRTYLVHCDMTQHMEKGMKAQLKAGKGNGDLWSVPGISASFMRENYLPPSMTANLIWLSVLALLAILLLGRWLSR